VLLLRLKVWYRLGVAFEGQNAFDEAARAFTSCTDEATAEVARGGADAATSTALNQTAADATARAAACRGKLDEQRARERSRLSAMFA
jgi:hypothetical protein